MIECSSQEALLKGCGLGDLFLYAAVCGHVVEDIVQELEGTVELDLYPTGGLLYALPPIVWTPPLDKTQPKNAESPKVIHPSPFGLGGRRELNG